MRCTNGGPPSAAAWPTGLLEKLPNLSYQTHLDKFILWGFVLQVMFIFASALAALLSKRASSFLEREGIDVNIVDDWLNAVPVGLVGIYFVYFALLLGRVRWSRRKIDRLCHAAYDALHKLAVSNCGCESAKISEMHDAVATLRDAVVKMADESHTPTPKDAWGAQVTRPVSALWDAPRTGRPSEARRPSAPGADIVIGACAPGDHGVSSDVGLGPAGLKINLLQTT